MKKLVGIFAIVTIAVGVYVYINGIPFVPKNDNQEPVEVVQSGSEDGDKNNQTKQKNMEATIEVVAENLTIPWDMVFLPEGGYLVTERPGRLLHLKEDGSVVEISIDNVRHRGEGGLLGLTLHPHYSENNYIYLYITRPGGNGTINSVERYIFDGDTLSDQTIIVENIPGASYHDGGRIEFGPDGYLYIATGDATQEALAQDTNSLAGKVLRVTDEGGIPIDNPFGNAVYSYGHRNPQGLAWDTEGNLWQTEHGRSGVRSGFDELNLIKKGGNYGWPIIQGDETRADMVTPVLHSGSSVTWAPASAAYFNGSIFFGGLRGETLYEARVGESKTNPELVEYLVGEYGRIRTVRISPDGYIYFMTSNQDGRGAPQSGDDKIIRVAPEYLQR